jgi:cytochrome c biogenesis protein CcmG, thiol:disulfide interchange protein DsbE
MACGGQPAAPARPQASLPAGFHLFDGGALGFQIGLAPGWEESGRDPSGVNFTSPSKGAAMLVHVERAASADLDAATGMIMFELTGGSGAAGGSESHVQLGGLPARRVRGGFDAAGATQQIDALVAIDHGLVWAVVLAGQAQRVGTDMPDFEKMTTTFRLQATRPSPPTRIQLGLPAPGFPELDRVKGPVVVNFFATWCGPCRQEMPMLSQRASQAGGRFTVLVVDTQDDATKVPGFLKELNVSFANVAYDRDGSLTQSYQLPGVPDTFFLDAKHVVRDWVFGPVTAQSLDKGLKAAGAA